MWQKVKHTVEWTVVEENIDEASLEKVANLDSSTYIFPAGRPPEDVDAQNAINYPAASSGVLD